MGKCNSPRPLDATHSKQVVLMKRTDPDSPSFYQILRVRKFPVVEVHVALGDPDIRVPRQPAGGLDPLLSGRLFCRTDRIDPRQRAGGGHTAGHGRHSGASHAILPVEAGAEAW